MSQQDLMETLMKRIELLEEFVYSESFVDKISFKWPEGREYEQGERLHDECKTVMNMINLGKFGEPASLLGRKRSCAQIRDEFGEIIDASEVRTLFDILQSQGESTRDVF